MTRITRLVLIVAAYQLSLCAESVTFKTLNLEYEVLGTGKILPNHSFDFKILVTNLPSSTADLIGVAPLSLQYTLFLSEPITYGGMPNVTTIRTDGFFGTVPSDPLANPLKPGQSAEITVAHYLYFAQNYLNISEGSTFAWDGAPPHFRWDTDPNDAVTVNAILHGPTRSVLTFSNTPLADAPEPASLLLSGTLFLLCIGAMRRRFPGLRHAHKEK